MSASTVPFSVSEELEEVPCNYPTTLPTLNADLTQYELMDGNFPLVAGSEMEPWTLENMDWTEIDWTKPAPHLQNGQTWAKANAGECWNPTEDISSAHEMAMNTISSNYPVHNILSQPVAERALYMTPPIYSSGYSAFPMSPLSDPYSTPEPSYDLNNWGMGQDRGDSQISHSPLSTPAYSLPSHISLSPEACSSHATDDEEECNTLEMPDGTKRRTSNWLPVDSSAGFVIGSHTPNHDYGATCVSHELQDIQGAFITEQPFEWSRTG